MQYFAPLYTYLNKAGVSTTCWYCSDENVRGHIDKQFNVMVKWDVPILEGYNYRFFKNWSWKPSIYSGFFGLINPGMLMQLFREPKSIVVVHGWAFLTHILVIIVSKFAGHIVCLRGESSLNQELLRSKRNFRIKKLLLAKLLFRFVGYFLYIGSQNKKFYQRLEVEETKLVFTPYSVDNQRFQTESKKLLSQKPLIKSKLGFPDEKKVVLFSAKYINKKRPLDLLSAYKSLRDESVSLVMVGDGELRKQMESFVDEHQLMNVFFTGFINQTDIPMYYSIADVFVMCSGEGETWGLSVNEALNYNIPIVVSDISGCSDDLVIEGINGFKFEAGNVTDLTDKLRKALWIKACDNTNLLREYSFETIAKQLTTVASII